MVMKGIMMMRVTIKIMNNKGYRGRGGGVSIVATKKFHQFFYKN